MTVVRFGADLLLHSPVAPDDALLAELGALGTVRWVVGPNRLHHLFLTPWQALGAEVWGVPALERKRTDLAFSGVVGDGVPWPDELVAFPTTCIPSTDEAVFFHAPSRTLIVTDLVFNLAATTPLLTRAAMRMALGYPGVRCSMLERALTGRDAARRDLARILEWDFGRIVMAHGEVVAEAAQDALRRAYDWVGLR
jgi:hypothetical protein